MRIRYIILPALLLLLLLFPYLFLTSGYKNFKYKYQVNFSIPDSDKYIHPLFVRLTLIDENIVKALYREDCNNVGSDNAYVYVEECSPTQVTIDFVYANSWSSTDTYPKPATVNFYFGGDQDKQYPPDFFKVFSHSYQYRTVSVPNYSCSVWWMGGSTIGVNIPITGSGTNYTYYHYLYKSSDNSYCSDTFTDNDGYPDSRAIFTFDNCYVLVNNISDGSDQVYVTTTTCSGVSSKNILQSNGTLVESFPRSSPFDGYGYALVDRAGPSEDQAILYIFRSCSTTPSSQHTFSSSETNGGNLDDVIPVPGGALVTDNDPTHVWKIDPYGNVVYSKSLPTSIDAMYYCLFDGDIHVCSDTTSNCIASSTGDYISTVPPYAYCERTYYLVATQGSYYIFHHSGYHYMDVVDSNGQIVKKLGLHALKIYTSGSKEFTTYWQPTRMKLLSYSGSSATVVSTYCFDNPGQVWFATVNATEVSPVYLTGDLNEDTFESYDSTPPTVTILSPTDGSTVTSPFTVDINVTDDGAWSYCELYLDSSLYSTTTDTNFTVTADDGTHSLYVKCYDFGGNSSTSSTISVTVGSGGGGSGGGGGETPEEDQNTQQEQDQNTYQEEEIPEWEQEQPQSTQTPYEFYLSKLLSKDLVYWIPTILLALLVIILLYKLKSKKS